MNRTRSALTLLALVGLAILPACGTSRSASTNTDSTYDTYEPEAPTFTNPSASTSENSTFTATTTSVTPENTAFRLDAHILEGTPVVNAFTLPTSAQPAFLSTDDRATLLTRTQGFTILSAPTIFTAPGQPASINTTDREASFTLSLNPEWQSGGSCRLTLSYTSTAPGRAPYTLASRTLTIPADTTAMFFVQPSSNQPPQFLLVAPRSLTTAAVNPQ
jgi:hypothetical protein